MERVSERKASKVGGDKIDEDSSLRDTFFSFKQKNGRNGSRTTNGGRRSNF